MENDSRAEAIGVTAACKNTGNGDAGEIYFFFSSFLEYFSQKRKSLDKHSQSFKYY